MAPVVAMANAGDCYWLLQAAGGCGGSTGFRIRVNYQSGHSIVIGQGDYLPVGCNVVSYIVETVDGGCNTLWANAPACTGQGAYQAVLTGGAGVGNPVTFAGGTGVGCAYAGGTCPTCDANDPNDPNGDDDGDGVRNECDPDWVSCVDADSDGCCDHCGGDCGTEDGCTGQDADDDGVCDECDADSSACVDANSDGCCDWCVDGQCDTPDDDCNESTPGFPDCCSSFPEAEACQAEECNTETPGYPDCCTTYPDAPDCEATECGPEHPCYSSGCDCCPEHPDYPDCEETCPDCDPCPKLDQIIALLTHIDNDLHGLIPSPSGSDPTPELSPLPQNPVGPDMEFTQDIFTGWSEWQSYGGKDWALSVPIPGRSPVGVTIGLDETNWGWASGPVTNALLLFKTMFYAMAWAAFAFKFSFAMIKLVGSL